VTSGNVERRLKCGSLFSGYGGLDLAVEEVFGARTVWFAETDPAAAKVYSSHWPGVPNLGDVTMVDWGGVERVDVLCGGFPCQSVSVSGLRHGLAEGTQSNLWAEMATAISALRPRWVVAENVPGLLSAPAARHRPKKERGPGDGGFGDGSGAVRGVGARAWGLEDEPAGSSRAMGAILSDLAGLRYDAGWVSLPAARVGAPHLRWRVFLLAWPAVPDPDGV
jgi:DNA (cytosine-5)-methyltransferase 1